MKTFNVSQPITVTRREVCIMHYPQYNRNKPTVDVCIDVYGVIRGVNKVRESEYEYVSPKNLRLLLTALHGLDVDRFDVSASVDITAYHGTGKGLTCLEVEWLINHKEATNA